MNPRRRTGLADICIGRVGIDRLGTDRPGIDRDGQVRRKNKLGSVSIRRLQSSLVLTGPVRRRTLPLRSGDSLSRALTSRTRRAVA